MKKYSLIFVVLLLGFMLCAPFVQGVVYQPLETDGKEGESIGYEMSITERAKEEGVVQIGIAMPSADYTYHTAIAEVMEKTAKEMRKEGDTIKLDFQYAKWDASVQIEQMNAFIRQKVDAIILCPINAKSMLPSLRTARELDIPIINVNMKVDTSSTEFITTYVGASMSEEGALAAQMIAQALGEEGGEVAIIEGAPGSDPQIYRTHTFFQTIGLHPSIEVVGIGNGGWDRHKAYLLAYDMIKQNENLDVIYAHDSNMAMGAIEAVEQLGKSGKIKVTGIGEGEEYLEAVRDNRLYGLITQSIPYEGEQSVRCAVAAARGEELRPWYKTPSSIMIKEEVKK